MSEEYPELVGLDDISQEELAALYLSLSEDAPETAPPPEQTWLPSLTKKQLDVFFDVTPNLLLVSSRFTGKSWAAGYKAVKHAYDFHGALVLIVAKTKRQLLAGGLMEKLGASILPDFAANVDDFRFSGPKVTVEKDLVYEVTNRFGTKSLIQMMSIGNDNDLQRKIKGLEASLIIIDEVTLYESRDIMTFLSGTLGRRENIPSEQQCLIATTNPADPEHWVAVDWSVLDESKRDAAFRVIQFLPEDNPSSKVAAYYERLRQALRNNPTQYARDIEGKWVSIPEGDAMFADVFVPEVHVRGNLQTGEVLHPVAGSPIIIGMDPGDTNHGVVFLQEIPTQDRMVWIAFDEVVYVGKKVSLQKLALDVIGRLQFWGDTLDYDFSFSAVSDRSAFDRFRAVTGSYDCKELEKRFAEAMPKHSRVKQKLHITPCPKPPGSVESRTRILRDMLAREELFLSAKCVNLIEMFTKITPGKDSQFHPGTHSPFKHAFDAIGYPIFHHKAGATLRTGSLDALKPQISTFGR